MERKRIIVKTKMVNLNGDMENFDVEYEFVNETWETRNAWGHSSILLREGHEIGRNKVRYYNRTWEEYRYKSCMSGCIYDLMRERYNDLLEKYKNDNNIVRMSQKRRDEFESSELFVNDRLYNEYKQVKGEL